MLIAFSGSPQKEGNLDRLMLALCQGVGEPYELYRLADYQIGPCRGCVQCASSRRCILTDDMRMFYDRISRAKALIVGGVNYFDRPNAFTHTFLERLYCFRHLQPELMNKPAAVLVVGGSEATAQVSQSIEHLLVSYHNMQVVGSLTYVSATPPCFVCGFGTTCKYGGPARWMSPEEFEQFNEIPPDMFHRWEDDAGVTEQLKSLARHLKAAIAFQGG